MEAALATLAGALVVQTCLVWYKIGKCEQEIKDMKQLFLRNNKR